MSLAADFEFARVSGEFRAQAPLLRYVAAINLGASKAEFVAAAVVAGYPAHAAGARFGESRRFSLETEPELTQDPQGRLTYPQE